MLKRLIFFLFVFSITKTNLLVDLNNEKVITLGQKLTYQNLKKGAEKTRTILLKNFRKFNL